MTDWRERLRARMEELRLVPREVTRRAGVNATMIHDILARGQTPSVENLSKIARALGYTLSDLYEGTIGLTLELQVMGVTRGREMWGAVKPSEQRVIPLTLFAKDSVSIEVGDDTLEPAYRRGDVLSGPKSSGSQLHNAIGSDCIVSLKDGQKILGVLLRGGTRATFNIRPLDRRREEFRDVHIEWAAPIHLILRTPA